jgi:RNA polymerase sigma-70 factor, ECF subfamily
MSEADELAQRFVERRDERTFRLLYRKASPRVYGFLLRLVRLDHALAEDLLQETWVRAVRSLDQFRGAAQFLTWLTGIAFNVWRERARLDMRRPLHALDETDESSGAELDLDQTIAFEQALANLNDDHRIVLILHDIEGFTHPEIAARLAVPEGTSKSRLSEARAALRALLARSEEKQR